MFWGMRGGALIRGWALKIIFWGGLGGRLFEAGRLLTYPTKGWALIRGGRLFEVGRLIE